MDAGPAGGALPERDPTGGVRAGAAVLARALPYVPAGVHLAVVDPDVGARRRALALRTADEDRLLVGPDNGLLVPAAERFGGPPRIHVGDVLPHDIAGAKRAGWLAIYVCQMGAPGATELPPELAALPPHRRPAAGMDWLAFRLERDRRCFAFFHPALPDEPLIFVEVALLGAIPRAIAPEVTRTTS